MPASPRASGDDAVLAVLSPAGANGSATAVDQENLDTKKPLAKAVFHVEQVVGSASIDEEKKGDIYAHLQPVATATRTPPFSAAAVGQDYTDYTGKIECFLI